MLRSWWNECVTSTTVFKKTTLVSLRAIWHMYLPVKSLFLNAYGHLWKELVTDQAS